VGNDYIIKWTEKKAVKGEIEEKLAKFLREIYYTNLGTPGR